MKPERAFVAERILASHCDALVRKGPAPDDHAPALARTGEKLARALRGVLAPLFGGEAPMITSADPANMDFAMLAETVSPLAANSLFAAGSQGAPLVCTIDGEAVLRLVDRAFGGRGIAPQPLPREFPMSADLMVARLEKAIAARLAAALGSDTPDAIQPVRRDGSLRQLQPFPRGTQLTVLTLTISDKDHTDWVIRIAFPLATLAHLFGHGERPPVARASTGPADPRSQPFADMPMAVRAVLVDIALPLSSLSKLEVGQVLSVPIARSVPLRVSDRTIAHGTIGALDDRVAIQINQLS